MRLRVEPGSRASLEPAGRAGAAPGWLIWGLLAISLAPIVLAPVIPSIDLYNHVARYFVLSRLAENPFLASNYAANWSLLPNIGMDVIGVGLMQVLPPTLAPKVVVGLIFLVQYTGVLALNRQLTGRVSVLAALGSAILLFSYILTWGFANFLLGLGLAFWGAAAWLRLRSRLPLAALVGSGIAIAIFLVHGVAFALYGLLVASLEFGRFLAQRPRNPVSLAAATAAVAVQAVIPLILFKMSATAGAAGGVTNADESIHRLAAEGTLLERLKELALYRLATTIRVSESHSAALDITLALAAALALAALFATGRARLAPAAIFVFAVSLVLVAAMPPTLFGVGYVADRMPLFAALVFTAGLCGEFRGRGLDRACLAVLATVCLVRIAYIGWDWSSYRGDLADFERSAADMPARAVVGYVNIANTDRLGETPRCEMYGPLLTLAHGQATPLFAFGTQQPLTLIGRLREAGQELPPLDKSGTRADAQMKRLVAADRSGFDYILLCGARDGLLAPHKASTVSTHGRFAVLRPAAPPVGRSAALSVP